MSDLTTYLLAFGTIAATVWGGIHGMWKLTQMSDRQVAVTVAILGIASGLLVQGVGFIKTPISGPLTWVCSGFFGLLAAFAGAGATDLNLAKAAIMKDPSQ
jgi:hypothetical protein